MFKTYRVETVWRVDRTIAFTRDFKSAEEAVAWNVAVPLSDECFERVLYRIEELPLHHADFGNKAA